MRLMINSRIALHEHLGFVVSLEMGQFALTGTQHRGFVRRKKSPEAWQGVAEHRVGPDGHIPAVA